jgi:hypothetical protein
VDIIRQKGGRGGKTVTVVKNFVAMIPEVLATCHQECLFADAMMRFSISETAAPAPMAQPPASNHRGPVKIQTTAATHIGVA